MRSVIFFLSIIFSTNLYALKYECTLNFGGHDSVPKDIDFAEAEIRKTVDRHGVEHVSQSVLVHYDENRSERVYSLVCASPITADSICNLSVSQLKVTYDTLEIPRINSYLVANVIFKSSTTHIGYSDHHAKVFLGCDLKN